MQPDIEPANISSPDGDGSASDKPAAAAAAAAVVTAVTSSDTATTQLDRQYGETRRGLTPRHVQLMAIGGSVGTALFVGIGGALSRAGPLSLLLGYLAWGALFVWPVYLCVAEMHALLPVRGSIFALAARFVDPALGFAMGWTYLYAGVMLVCLEYSAVAAVAQYWTAAVSPAVWIAATLVTCAFVNVAAVRWYGEAEFVMASLKVLLLAGLILLTLVTMLGGNPDGDVYGFRYWTGGDAMHPYHAEGDLGRFLGFWKAVIYAGFTISGPDMIALSAGEIQNPRRTIPRVARLIFYRIIGFYVVGVLAVGIICSSRDPRLLGAVAAAADHAPAGAAASPWVIGIQRLRLRGLPHLINALILTSGWSCGNAYLYASSRTLYGLARDGHAPRFFARCTARTGVPVRCVVAVSALACVTFLVASASAARVFYWFVDLVTGGLVMTYTMMAAVFLGWHRARRVQGLRDADLPYVAPLAPAWPWLALLLGCLALLFVGFDTFAPFDPQAFATSYFCLPYSAALFAFWKLYKGTSLVRPEEADLVTGRAEADAECARWEDGGLEENWRKALEAMPWWRRCWERLW